MRVLVLSDHSDNEDRRDRLRVIAGLGCEIILGTPGGVAGADGSLRIAPIPVKGDPAAELRWDAAALRRLVADLQPALIHLEAEPESALADTAAAVARKLAVPLVLAASHALGAGLGYLEKRRARKVLSGVSGVIGPNRVAMDYLHEQAPTAIAAAIPMVGFTLPPLGPRPAGPLVIGFAGRLVAERGADTLITALGQTYGQWEAVIAGTGPDQERLEALIERFGLAARIKWLGGLRRETLAAFWPLVDCLVVPSRETPGSSDPTPPLLVEAMGRGIVPVVTRAGALPEIVGPAGLVVEDNAEALAGALQEFVIEPARCRSAAAAARQWVLDRYVTSVVATRTLEFWRAAREHAAPTPAHSN